MGCGGGGKVTCFQLLLRYPHFTEEETKAQNTGISQCGKAEAGIMGALRGCALGCLKTQSRRSLSLPQVKWLQSPGTVGILGGHPGGRG